MIKTLKKNHYLATQPSEYVASPHHRDYANSTDGEDSHRADSERTMSEYAAMQDRDRDRDRERRTAADRDRDRRRRREDDGSDVYVTSAAYRPPSEISVSLSRGNGHHHHLQQQQYRAPSELSVRSARSGRSGRSRSTVRVDRKRGLVVETMSAPNPFCPHTRGMCCLMLLLNLGLVLVTLGIVIVVQFFQPLFVWILGIVFLIFGFLTLVGSLIYCVTICRDAKTPAQIAAEDHHWTRHWSKGFGTHPEIHYRADDKASYAGDRY